MNTFSYQRLLAFTHKETLQVFRDPSSIIIAVVLPLMMIFLFAFGVSLDYEKIKIGLVQEDNAPDARDLSAAFNNTKYFSVENTLYREALNEAMLSSKIRGIIVIPEDFSRRLHEKERASIQVLADGTETNTANFIRSYATGVVDGWWKGRQDERDLPTPPQVEIAPRVWFNPDLESRNVILPGSIAVIMSLIGTLLTALVVAREWEHGSMEAMLSTPIRVSELIIGKMIPYFVLGILSMFLCVSCAIFIFSVPFVGSIWILALGTSIFLLAGLSQGLLISILSKNQFLASQIAINAAFLPAYMLSGFLYEIQTMPWLLRTITYVFAPRYFVSIIQTNFLAGTVWPLLIRDLLAMLGITLFFLYFVVRKCKKSLE